MRVLLEHRRHQRFQRGASSAKGPCLHRRRSQTRSPMRRLSAPVMGVDDPEEPIGLISLAEHLVPLAVFGAYSYLRSEGRGCRWRSRAE